MISDLLLTCSHNPFPESSLLQCLKDVYDGFLIGSWGSLIVIDLLLNYSDKMKNNKPEHVTHFHNGILLLLSSCP